MDSTKTCTIPNDTSFVFSVNKQIATEPFPEYSVQAIGGQTFAVTKQRVSLTPLKVLHYYEDEDFSVKPGNTIWLSGEFYAATWAKKIWDFQGVPTILVPVQLIVLVTT